MRKTTKSNLMFWCVCVCVCSYRLILFSTLFCVGRLYLNIRTGVLHPTNPNWVRSPAQQSLLFVFVTISVTLSFNYDHETRIKQYFCVSNVGDIDRMLSRARIGLDKYSLHLKTTHYEHLLDWTSTVCIWRPHIVNIYWTEQVLSAYEDHTLWTSVGLDKYFLHLKTTYCEHLLDWASTVCIWRPHIVNICWNGQIVYASEDHTLWTSDGLYKQILHLKTTHCEHLFIRQANPASEDHTLWTSVGWTNSAYSWRPHIANICWTGKSIIPVPEDHTFMSKSAVDFYVLYVYVCVCMCVCVCVYIYMRVPTGCV
jgi:transposase